MALTRGARLGPRVRIPGEILEQHDGLASSSLVIGNFLSKDEDRALGNLELTQEIRTLLRSRVKARR